MVTPSNDPRSYRVNSDRLLATGFRPKKTVDDAIKEIVGMYRQGAAEGRRPLLQSEVDAEGGCREMNTTRILDARPQLFADYSAPPAARLLRRLRLGAGRALAEELLDCWQDRPAGVPLRQRRQRRQCHASRQRLSLWLSKTPGLGPARALRCRPTRRCSPASPTTRATIRSFRCSSPCWRARATC